MIAVEEIEEEMKETYSSTFLLPSFFPLTSFHFVSASSLALLPSSFSISFAFSSSCCVEPARASFQLLVFDSGCCGASPKRLPVAGWIADCGMREELCWW